MTITHHAGSDSLGYTVRERTLLHQCAEQNEHLNAMWLFQPFNLIHLVRHLDNIVDIIDARLGQLEKRLDEAKIPEVPIDDDEVEQYLMKIPAVSELEIGGP